jgi:hypothetical protein
VQRRAYKAPHGHGETVLNPGATLSTTNDFVHRASVTRMLDALLGIANPSNFPRSAKEISFQRLVQVPPGGSGEPFTMRRSCQLSVKGHESQFWQLGLKAFGHSQVPKIGTAERPLR